MALCETPTGGVQWVRIDVGVKYSIPMFINPPPIPIKHVQIECSAQSNVSRVDYYRFSFTNFCDLQNDASHSTQTTLFSKDAEESVQDGFRLISDPLSPLKNLTYLQSVNMLWQSLYVALAAVYTFFLINYYSM